MSVYFVDTSALAKRYLVEAGSAWVESWIAPSEGNAIVVSEIVIAEMRSLLARRVREGLDDETAKAIKLAFSLHLSPRVPSDRCQPTGAAFRRAAYRETSASHARCHSSSGCFTSPIHFRTTHLTSSTADKQQLHAAAAEGFPADNPTTHS